MIVLSARILEHVENVNNFAYTPQLEFTEGDAGYLYLQLTDASKNRCEEGYRPAGVRYCPVAGSTLSVVIDNLDDDKKVTRTATQPFTGDASIWRISLLSTDPIRGTANLRLTLVESGVTKRGTVQAALCVRSQGAV